MFFRTCHETLKGALVILVKLRAWCDCENDILADPFRCPKNTPPDRQTRQARSPTLWSLCYRSLAFKGFCLLILSLCPGWEGLGFGLGCSGVFLQALNSKQLFFSHLSCETQTSPALQKHLFRLSKIVIFPRCSYETQRSPALQKKTFFRLYVFFALLLWNSDKPGFAKKQLFRP